MLPLPIKSHHHLQAQGIPRNLHLPLFLWRSNSHPDPYNPHRSGCVMKQKAGHIPDLFSVDERSHNLHSTSPGFCRQNVHPLGFQLCNKKDPNYLTPFNHGDFVQFSGSMLIGLLRFSTMNGNQITKKNPTKCRSLAGRCIEDFAAFPVPLCPARRADAQGKKDRLLNRRPPEELTARIKILDPQHVS